LIFGAGLGGLIYAPWFAWAWWYYGSPVPHTIIAKGAYMAPLQLSELAKVPLETLAGRSMLVDLFMPTYWGFGGWPTWLKHIGHGLALLAAFGWLLRPMPLAGRRASLAVFIGMFYICSIILFPWYAPPWTALAAIAVAFIADGIFARLAVYNSVFASVWRTLVIAAVTVQVAVLPSAAWQMRAAQTHIETGIRHSIGSWLREHADPRDTIFLEPLGYVGYYSRLKTHDFPGLSSAEVVAVVRKGARRYADIITALRPTWVLLRLAEAQRPEFATTGILNSYELTKTWDVLPQLDQIHFLPGRGWMEGDARFLLFRRKPASAPGPDLPLSR
jgi:hypothetical protein